MNKLDPALKRLLKWAQVASPSKPEEAPFGFAGRIQASRKNGSPPTLVQQLQQSAWGLGWASLALVVCGVLVLVNLRPAPGPEAEISSVLNFVANNLLQ
jgi:hypothetical protein